MTKVLYNPSGDGINPNVRKVLNANMMTSTVQVYDCNDSYAESLRDIGHLIVFLRAFEFSLKNFKVKDKKEKKIHDSLLYSVSKNKKALYTHIKSKKANDRYVIDIFEQKLNLIFINKIAKCSSEDNKFNVEMFFLSTIIERFMNKRENIDSLCSELVNKYFLNKFHDLFLGKGEGEDFEKEYKAALEIEEIKTESIIKKFKCQ